MKEFRPVLIFLIKFFVTYIVLFALYNWYLSNYIPQNIVDPYTKEVAFEAEKFMNFLGFEAKAIPSEKNPWSWFFLDGKGASYINEGCNAVSVMIVFVPFIVAFSTTWKQTISYVLGGLILMHTMNIARVSWLSYIYRYHHDFGKTAHDYLFPAIIYGTVVLLWIIWIKFFVLKNKTPKKDEKVA